MDRLVSFTVFFLRLYAVLFSMHCFSSDSYMFKESRFWGQDYIGLDLCEEDEVLRQIFKDINSSMLNTQSICLIDGNFCEDSERNMIKSLPNNKIAIFRLKSLNQDESSCPALMDDHAIRSLNNIIGEKVGGYQVFLPPIRNIEFILGDTEHSGAMEVQMLNHFALSGSKIANVSFSLAPFRVTEFNFEKLRSVIDRISLQGKIIVASAGNAFPRRNEPQSRLFKGVKNSFLVGSIDATGFISDGSQEDESLLLLAPGDDIASRDSLGNLCSHALTSASAPLVTGVLSSIKAMLPQISESSLIYILQKTSITTLTQKIGSRKNGKGLVNAYKAYKVATLIKSKLESKEQSKLNIEDIIKDMNFDDESSFFYQQFQKTKNIQSLRKAFYLRPSSELAQLLSDTYLESGRKFFSFFYKGLANSLRENLSLCDVAHYLINVTTEEYLNKINTGGSRYFLLRDFDKSVKLKLIEQVLQLIDEELNKDRASSSHLVAYSRLIKYIPEFDSLNEKCDKIYENIIEKLIRIGDLESIAKFFSEIHDMYIGSDAFICGSDEIKKKRRSIMIKKYAKLYKQIYEEHGILSIYRPGDEEILDIKAPWESGNFKGKGGGEFEAQI